MGLLRVRRRPSPDQNRCIRARTCLFMAGQWWGAWWVAAPAAAGRRGPQPDAGEDSDLWNCDCKKPATRGCVTGGEDE
jgi:hypothetical protein